MSNLTKKQEQLKASLKHGDRGKIAKKLLMKRNELSMVLNGKREDERVWTAIEELIADRKPKASQSQEKDNGKFQKSFWQKQTEEITEQYHEVVEKNTELHSKLSELRQENAELMVKIVQEKAANISSSGDSDETLSNLQQQYSNAQEHIVRLKKERDELKERLKELMAERGQKGLSYDLVETLLAIPNTDLQVKMLHEIKQQFLA